MKKLLSNFSFMTQTLLLNQHNTTHNRLPFIEISSPTSAIHLNWSFINENTQQVTLKEFSHQIYNE